MKKPLISVIIPAYNCAGYISQAIDSVLCQRVSLEIIVIDDCSRDNLDEVMEKYRDSPVLFYVKNRVNMGAAQSRNRGMSMASGEYIAFLDGDDYWEPDKLEKQLKVIQNSNAVLCCTARELITGEGRPTGRTIPVKEKIIYTDLLKHNCINCSSVLIKTQVAREFPMCYEESHEDYIMWLRILKKYNMAYGINEPLLKYRISNKGKSGDKFHSARMTFKVYRYMGFGYIKSILCFISYTFHGIWKYCFGRIK
ncbi:MULTISPECIES: glycosyltransferase family 2 protein [Blautia]|uniref:glycosyltransferase family 2 protein n=1 Tax=Blautia TaxID=572511 RepID=UPI000BA43A40|nr:MULTISPECIES: glycosyltransferase family 2 protein [Blautia]